MRLLVTTACGYLSVGHQRELCQSGCTDQDAIWMRLGWAQQTMYWVDPPRERGIWGRSHFDMPTLTRRDDNGSAVRGSSGSTNLSGSRGSRVGTRDPFFQTL